MINNPSEHKLTNLYLIGFMGTGKSSVGKVVAEKLGLRFIDSDLEIEKETNLSVSQIFSSLGEAKFRDLEKNFINQGHPSSDCLISCGGGLPVQSGMMKILKNKGHVFCLSATSETIYQRTKNNSDRPLLQSPDPMAKIKKLILEREEIYSQADHIISSEQRSIQTMAEIIIQKYREADDINR